MLTIRGVVQNIYSTPEGVDKEGKKYGGDHKVQLIANSIMKNGEMRVELVTLTTDNHENFSKCVGKEVYIPVSAFARGGTIYYSMQPGTLPRVAKAS